jgi:autotransporter-associated beta strand protein
MSGGSLTKTGNDANHLLIGAGHDGVLNQTGGTVTSVLSTTRIADGPTGTWNLSGGSAVLSVLHIAESSGNIGTLNLNGGTLSATEVTTGNAGGTSTLNLNGGTLIAGSGANANFLHGLTSANVMTNGAIIDSGANTINVSQALLGNVNGDGGLTKLGTGTLYLNGVNTYTNATQVTAGALGGAGTIAGPVNVAAGARLSPGTASIGTLTINNTLNLDASSSTLVKISMDGGATNDMVTGLTSVTYGGTLVVTNVGTTPLVAGTQFHLFNAGSETGNYTSVTVLPAGTGTFDPSTGILTITSSGVVTFNPVTVSGNTLILTGNGGAAPGSPYTLLTTTNLATPLSMWTTNDTGTLDGSGMFSNNIPIDPSGPAQFFNVRVP